MYWTAKRLKELKARGYRLRYMTLEEANAEVTSEELQAASDKRLQPEVASTKLQATSHKHQATSDSKKDSKSTRDKQQAS